MICAGLSDTLCRKAGRGPFGEGARLPDTTKLLCDLTLSQVLATELTAHNRLKDDFVKDCNWCRLCGYAIARTAFYIR